jgi:hypothetical protein
MVNCAASIQKIDDHDGSTTTMAPSFSSVLTAENVEDGTKGGIMPENVHFSANGDGYCNVQREGIWCQAVALHA